MLDTNAVSALLRQPLGRVTQHYQLVSGDVATSIIVLAELRFGIHKAEARKLAAGLDVLLRELPVLPWDTPADRAYAELRVTLERAGTPIGSNDLLIAAHALALNCVLVTDNEREFARIPGLKVENWLRPA